MKSKKYITPMLTVVTFKAEQGFAASNPASQSSFLDMFLPASSEDYNSQAQQNWHEEGGSLFNW